MSKRGECDYKRYQIKPQRNMGWSKAVQFMLQSPTNLVSDGRFYFRIIDGVLQYHYPPWADAPHAFREMWGNAASQVFTLRGSQPFDAVEVPVRSNYYQEDSDPRFGLLVEQIQKLEGELAAIKGEK